MVVVGSHLKKITTNKSLVCSASWQKSRWVHNKVESKTKEKTYRLCMSKECSSLILSKHNFPLSQLHLNRHLTQFVIVM